MAESAKTKSTLSAPQRALKKIGLERDIDLALHLPLRYEDETRINSLNRARDGDQVQFLAIVKSAEIVFKPRRQLVVQVQEVVAPDSTGRLDSEELNFQSLCTLRFFNFYPSLQKTLTVGQTVRVRGEVKGGVFGKTMMHPTLHSAQSPLPNALTPIYPTTAGLPQAYLRKAVLTGLDRCMRLGAFEETIPASYAKDGLWSLARSVQFLHQPEPSVSVEDLEDKSHPSWQRLKAEELLAQQISQLKAKRERLALKAPALGRRALTVNHSASCLSEELTEILPFKLTRAQARVVEEIFKDLKSTTPMHRLLQGDVGSGKTVVAALAAAQCIDAGHQCVLMAPTEILAEQHFKKLVDWLSPLLGKYGLSVAWLSGSQKKKERQIMLELTQSGQAALVVGTHAVIQEQVKFNSLGLVLIDEQHRFGVAQRLALKDKLENLEPHMLMMSATPIPRTLAMSYYADLDVSTIDELPPGRTPVITKVVSDQRRDEVISRIEGQLKMGRQVYWVCPLIEESEAIDLTNATETHDLLSKTIRDVQVGLLHSKMPAQEKKGVMQRFTEGETGVLVSTTVIEVGVDVPNASLMVIEHAERFGLSQLHQLRGRVGRGAAASACILMYSVGEKSKLSDTATARLKAMAQTQDGFEIARIDLEIRGPGEFLGHRQSGAAMLRFADLSTDGNWLEWARQLAPQLLDHYPALAAKHVSRWMGNKLDYLKA